MPQVTGTKTETKPVIDTTAKATATANKAHTQDKKVVASTDEYLGQNQDNRGAYDPDKVETQFDGKALENATHAKEVGNAAYSANPPDRNKGKPKAKMVRIKLLKDYGPGTDEQGNKIEYEHEGAGDVIAWNPSGKIRAGSHISLQEDEALRLVKLQSAELADPKAKT